MKSSKTKGLGAGIYFCDAGSFFPVSPAVFYRCASGRLGFVQKAVPCAHDIEASSYTPHRQSNLFAARSYARKLLTSIGSLTSMLVMTHTRQ